MMAIADEVLGRTPEMGLLTTMQRYLGQHDPKPSQRKRLLPATRENESNIVILRCIMDTVMDPPPSTRTPRHGRPGTSDYSLPNPSLGPTSP